MLTIEALRDLFRYMEWADAAVWRALLDCVGAREDVILRNQLLHLHLVQQAFLQVWRGESPVFPDPADFPDLTTVRGWAVPYYEAATAFLVGVDSRRVAHRVTMPWVIEFEEREGRKFEAPTLAETIFQVNSHSTYHRGQINARLRELGGKPPLVDYIAWIWFGRPVADWSASGAVRP